ncbi:MAG: 3D domain-containing protein [Bdellovibrionota bacterium]
MRIVLLSLCFLLACGKHSSKSSHHNPPERDESNPPVIVTPVPMPPPSEVDEADMMKITPLLPTMYYTAQEEKTNCKGKYGNATYDGSERSNIISVEGKLIATVCTRFYRVLLMEGSAILRDRGNGKISVNYGGIVNGERRYHLLERCIYGEGVKKNLCLLPYHTLATDNKIHAIGDIIYIPKTVGIVLPDGSQHEGYFIVRDTGAAFNGVGAQRVDMFTGLDPDYANVFQAAGFHHKKEIQAFKIKGHSAELIKEKLENKFGEIY